VCHIGLSEEEDRWQSGGWDVRDGTLGVRVAQGNADRRHLAPPDRAMAGYLEEDTQVSDVRYTGER
jgi:hypothetical protein